MSTTSQTTTVDLAEKLLADTKAEVESLKGQVTSLESVKTDLEQQLKNKDERIVELTGALKEAEELVQEQQEQLAKQPQVIVSTEPLITHKKIQYRIAIPNFFHKGQPYTAEDLKGNSALVSALIESKSAVLVPVEK